MLMLTHLRTRTPIIFGIFVIFLGIFVSEYFLLYQKFAHFDKVMHALGGLAAAWIGLSLLQEEVTHMAAWKQILIFVSFATLAGVLWEFAEFAANTTRTSWPLLYHYFHGGDIADTLGDIASDIIGALALSLWALRKERS